MCPEKALLRASALSHAPRCHGEPPVQLYLPLRVGVRLQGLLVRARLHDQAPVGLVSPLHGGPGAHDAVRRPEREIVQVLMHGVEKGLLICNTGKTPSASSNGARPPQKAPLVAFTTTTRLPSFRLSFGCPRL